MAVFDGVSKLPFFTGIDLILIKSACIAFKGKDLEGQIGREVEEHKSRIFEIISGYKENVGCVFGQNVSEAAEVPDMTVGF